jgi:hypothetical protein
LSPLEIALKLTPLVLLLCVAGVVIWRGMKRPPDGSKNGRDIGGGPGGEF